MVNSHTKVKDVCVEC